MAMLNLYNGISFSKWVAGQTITLNNKPALLGGEYLRCLLSCNIYTGQRIIHGPGQRLA